jgi:hypothetical protein
MENVSARVDPISISDLFAQLLIIEARVEGQHQAAMSANPAKRGGGSFTGRGGGCDGGRATRGGFGRGYGRGHGTGERPTCQTCEKIGHSARRCWKRFDRDFKLEEKSTNNASNTGDASYDVDTNWYTNTGATDHITSQLDKLTTKEKYTGKEKIQTASGSSMGIDYIGNSILHTPTHDLCLNKVLHIPITQKNLVSIHRLTTDNLIFIEYHSRYFLIKDRVTRKVLLQGRYRGGIYPWSSLECSSSKCVFLATKPSVIRWHDRLGHPSMRVIDRIVRENKLPCSSIIRSQFVMCVNKGKFIS